LLGGGVVPPPVVNDWSPDEATMLESRDVALVFDTTFQ